jgi:hypothetical protein
LDPTFGHHGELIADLSALPCVLGVVMLNYLILSCVVLCQLAMGTPWELSCKLVIKLEF